MSYHFFCGHVFSLQIQEKNVHTQRTCTYICIFAYFFLWLLSLPYLLFVTNIFAFNPSFFFFFLGCDRRSLFTFCNLNDFIFLLIMRRFFYFFFRVALGHISMASTTLLFIHFVKLY